MTNSSWISTGLFLCFSMILWCCSWTAKAESSVSTTPTYSAAWQTVAYYHHRYYRHGHRWGVYPGYWGGARYYGARYYWAPRYYRPACRNKCFVDWRGTVVRCVKRCY